MIKKKKPGAENKLRLVGGKIGEQGLFIMK